MRATWASAVAVLFCLALLPGCPKSEAGSDAGAGTACDDGDPCTTDAEEAGSCLHTALADGAKCGAQRFCHGGECGSCNPGAPCLLESPTLCHSGAVSCETGLPVCVDYPSLSTVACEDGDPCTREERCDGAGSCRPSVRNVCRARECVAASVCDGLGGCIETPSAKGTSCDVANACGQSACDGAGACIGDPSTAHPNGEACGTGICCGGGCLRNDPDHCGSCETRCPEACRLGACCSLQLEEKSYPGPAPVALAVGDLNGDPAPDVVSGGMALSVFLNDGIGELRSVLEMPMESIALAIADVDGDGRADIVAADGETVSVLLNHVTGDFTVISSAATGVQRPDELVVHDLDADGNQDLVAVGDILCAALGHGDGTFAECRPIGECGPYGALVVADLSGDGRLDIAVGTPGFALWQGLGAGVFSKATLPGFPADVGFAKLLGVGDVDGDGSTDLIVISQGIISVLANNGAGSYARYCQDLTGMGAVAGTARVLDWNGDGLRDILLMGAEETLLLEQRAGKEFGVGPAWGGAKAVADFDRDGYPDLVSGALSGEGIAVWRNVCR